MLTTFLTPPLPLKRHHRPSQVTATLQPNPSTLFRLPALPFPPSQVFLPGQTKQLHLYEARYLSLFETSLKSHDSTLAHVLFDPARGALAAHGTLARITRWRRMDLGVGVEITGIGRVKVIELAAQLPFWSAVVQVLGEESADSCETVAAKVKEIVEMCERLGEQPFSLRDDVRVFNDKHTEGSAEEHMKILQKGVQSAGGAATGWSWAAWQVIESNIAERQRALEGQDVTERLRLVEKRLEQRMNRLAAKLALKEAFVDSTD